MDTYSETTKTARQREDVVRKINQKTERVLGLFKLALFPLLLLVILLFLTRIYRVRAYVGNFPRTPEAQAIVLQRFSDGLQNNPYAIEVQVTFDMGGKPGVFSYQRTSHLLRWDYDPLSSCRANEENIRGVIKTAVSKKGNDYESPFGYFITRSGRAG